MSNLTREQVLQPWFKTEHLMAIWEGHSFEDIREKSIDEVNKLRQTTPKSLPIKTKTPVENTEPVLDETESAALPPLLISNRARGLQLHNRAAVQLQPLVLESLDCKEMFKIA